METLRAHRADAPADEGVDAEPGDVIARLLRTAAQVTSEQARRLRATRLSPSAFNVLLELADGADDEGLQPCSLATRLAVSRPSMCGLIDGLEAKGLVGRAPHHHDGRRVLVSLSPSGRKLVEDHRAAYDAMLDRLLDDLTGDDRQCLMGLLQRIGV